MVTGATKGAENYSSKKTVDLKTADFKMNALISFAAHVYFERPGHWISLNVIDHNTKIPIF